MPRRALVLITVVVLALHWFALGGMPLGGTNEGSAQQLAFHTRMVTPEPEPEVAHPAAPTPPPTPAPVKPRPPKPKPAPKPVAPAEPLESAVNTAEALPDPAPVTEPVATAEADQPAPESPAAPASAASAPDEPASVASAPAAVASAPEKSGDDLSAGVDIRPPGAAGGQASTEPPPVKLPASVSLSYAVEGEVKQLRYNVNGALIWVNNGATYEARQEVSAFLIGTRSQTSTGKITPQGLAPTRFGDKGKREVAAHFDYEQNQIIFSANSQRAAFSAGAQDRVSVLIQLGAMMAAAPDRYPSGTQITLTTVGPRSADRWTFTVGERETLDLPAGPTPAIRLQKLPRHERDLKADLWLGTDKQYLPVRLRLTQSNGDYAELSLK